MNDFIKLNYYTQGGLINENALRVTSLSILSAVDLVECEIILKKGDLRISKIFRNEKYKYLDDLIKKFYQIDFEKLLENKDINLAHDIGNIMLEFSTSKIENKTVKLTDTEIINLFRKLIDNYLLQDEELRIILDNLDK